MTEELIDFLVTASEQTKRDTSEYKYHYPTEITVWEIFDDVEDGKIVTVCGCNPGFEYKYGSTGHE